MRVFKFQRRVEEFSL